MPPRTDIKFMLFIGAVILSGCAEASQPAGISESEIKEIEAVITGLAQCGVKDDQAGIEYVSLYQSTEAIIDSLGEKQSEIVPCLSDMSPMPVLTFKDKSDEDAYEAYLKIKYAELLGDLKGDGSWQEMSSVQQEEWIAKVLKSCGLPADRVQFVDNEIHLRPKVDDRYEDVSCLLEGLRKVGAMADGNMGFIGNAPEEESN